MNNPYFITGPALVSFSGGRTSAYMLRQILDAHGCTLPPDVVVTFANTGRERTETLDFVRECGARWNVPIVWLEWRMGEHGSRFEVVSHNSASRDGEPFKALIDSKAMLPNPMLRYCTIELKIRVMRDYARSLGWDHWTNIVGLRADEPGRVGKALDLENHRERWVNACPLATAGATERDILAYWGVQPFNLRLKSFGGNCDCCHLKALAKITRIMRERPDLAQWWIDQEEPRLIEARARAAAITIADAPTEGPAMDVDDLAEGQQMPMRTLSHQERDAWVIKTRASVIGAAKFRADRPSYAELLKQVQTEGPTLFSIFDDQQSCEIGCTDQEPTADLAALRDVA